MVPRVRLRRSPGAGAELADALGVFEQPLQPAGQRGLIADRGEHPVLVVLDEVRHTADRGGDDHEAL